MSFDPTTMTARELEIADTAFREGQRHPLRSSPYARLRPSQLALRYSLTTLDDEMDGEDRNAHALALDKILAPVRDALETAQAYMPDGDVGYAIVESARALLAPGGGGA